MNKFLLAITILAFIIATITVVVIKPALYKQVLFSPAEVEMQTTEPEIQEKEIRVKEIQPLKQKEEKIKITPQEVIKETQKLINTEGNTSQKNVKEIKKQEQKSSAKDVKTSKPRELPASIKEILNPQQKTETRTVKKETTETETETKIQPQQKEVVQPPLQQPQIKQLTEQEEIIVWNRWRSNLQNKVMRDVKIDAPLGTRFRFSFTVDRYGQISNLKVWSDNPEYTSLAVRQIKPLLLSYQGQPILNFPQGTKRIVTNVTGGFVLATFDKYSKPSDYSDVERIKYLR